MKKMDAADKVEANAYGNAKEMLNLNLLEVDNNISTPMDELMKVRAEIEYSRKRMKEIKTDSSIPKAERVELLTALVETLGSIPDPKETPSDVLGRVGYLTKPWTTRIQMTTKCSLSEEHIVNSMMLEIINELE